MKKKIENKKIANKKSENKKHVILLTHEIPIAFDIKFTEHDKTSHYAPSLFLYAFFILTWHL